MKVWMVVVTYYLLYTTTQPSDDNGVDALYNTLLFFFLVSEIVLTVVHALMQHANANLLLFPSPAPR